MTTLRNSHVTNEKSPISHIAEKHNAICQGRIYYCRKVSAAAAAEATTTATAVMAVAVMMVLVAPQTSIGLYRENAIAIESEANYSFGGNVYYVTMQITLPIP